MRRSVLILLVGAFGFTACQTVQTTNPGVVGVDRPQRFLVSDEQVQTASAQAYAQMTAEARQKGILNRDQSLTARVRGIAARLERASSSFRPDAPGWQWEVNTLATDELNAFAMPGGKIMVYEGIVKRLNLTDAEIAAIMGHEVAHALREHSRERISRQYAQQLAISGAAALAGVDTSAADLANMVANVTLQLPFGRDQESEADTVGLELMARAGYDPNAAVSLWQKMVAAQGQQQPEFLSTHPSPGNRIENLQALVPRVLPLYRTASGSDRVTR